MRNAKYVSAYEYAQMLRRGSNHDVADFAEEFLEALDFLEETTGSEPVRVMVDRHTRDAGDDVKTFYEKIDWLCSGSDMLGRIEAAIEEAFPDLADLDGEDGVAELIKRLRPPPLEYDL